jgi:hypothetical protein
MCFENWPLHRLVGWPLAFGGRDVRRLADK